MEPKKILAIEDDAFLSGLVAGKLVESGLSVVNTATGKDGLAKARLIHPDLILLDIMLPDMGGFEVLEKIKADPETRNIPVVILSNLGGREEIERGVIKKNTASRKKSRLVRALRKATTKVK